MGKRKALKREKQHEQGTEALYLVYLVNILGGVALDET